MHLLDQGTLGIVILLLLGMLVIVKQMATGSILDKPKGNLWVWLVNLFNLFFLLIANPLAALFLITRRFEAFDPSHLGVGVSWLLTGLEIGGLALYGTGHLLMAWALISLRGNYQVGGSAPRAADQMVIVGPYRLIRHPLYTAALCISLGLACLIQSLACFSMFCIYLVLMSLLIPLEEKGLQQAYGEQYSAYQQKVKRLIPLLC
jgi:protein-S-isoprenylcysteine O-methyltransferase Ste14